ncbi:MAG: hypothetical protein QXS62_05640 [Sulfolobales archaeon]
MVATRRMNVTAIYSDELPSVLKKLGLYDDVVGGRASCYVCGRRLSLDNIGGILGVDGKPVLICDSYSCIAKASAISNGRFRS